MCGYDRLGSICLMFIDSNSSPWIMLTIDIKYYSIQSSGFDSGNATGSEPTGPNQRVCLYFLYPYLNIRSTLLDICFKPSTIPSQERDVNTDINI